MKTDRLFHRCGSGVVYDAQDRPRYLLTTNGQLQGFSVSKDGSGLNFQRVYRGYSILVDL